MWVGAAVVVPGRQKVAHCALLKAVWSRATTGGTGADYRRVLVGYRSPEARIVIARSSTSPRDPFLAQAVAWVARSGTTGRYRSSGRKRYQHSGNVGEEYSGSARQATAGRSSRDGRPHRA